MKKVLYFLLVLTLVFSLTACGGSDGDSAGQSGSISGEIDETAVIADNDDVKITFEKAYYNRSDDGVLAVLNVENKLGEDIGLGFYDVVINGIGFDAWQEDDTIAAGESREVVYKLVSTANLKMASIDTLSQLILGCYYYPTEGDAQSLDSILVKNSKNPNLKHDGSYSGKEITIDYVGGKLKIVVGVDQMVLNEEGIPEFHIYSENEGNASIVTDYTVVYNGAQDIEVEHCGPYLYDKDYFLECIFFEGADIDSYKGVTLKNIIIEDFDENELFKLDELVIPLDDLKPLSY